MDVWGSCTPVNHINVSQSIGVKLDGGLIKNTSRRTSRIASQINNFVTTEMSYSIVIVTNTSKKNVFGMGKVAVVLQHRFQYFPIFCSKLITLLQQVEKVLCSISTRRMTLDIKPWRSINIYDKVHNFVELWGRRLLGHVQSQNSACFCQPPSMTQISWHGVL